ncbi:DeoR/GlpR family DNA-binding transcription regulator [Paenibacillus hamazuiensis]|uniref:DeoR/GlpR family DNA-binding transcription regulator n=1 Tax=Paenibacillus hamazuiensis TaxID=2936508 RepID=UPI00200C5D21|nr:DeoR/GlpR family DNA-binding transcription regulator [Paenibacillus hamazuiensis]
MTKGLFIEERRKRIIELLQQEGRVQVKELAELFSVTEDAIRKDLRFLEGRQQLKKTYGGAVLPSKLAGFVPYKERGEPEKKLPLARIAATLIEPGETVFIESSSYTNLMFRELAPIPGVTVVTNSIHGLAELAGKVRVVQTGGDVHAQDESSYGFFTLSLIRTFNFDKIFLRTSGISSEWQVTTSLRESMELKKTAIAQAKTSVLLVEEEGWHRKDAFNVCDLEDIDIVVTDMQDAAIHKKLRQKGVRTEIALAPQMKRGG